MTKLEVISQKYNDKDILELVNDKILEGIGNVDVSKLLQIEQDTDTLSEEQYNSLKGKTWYSELSGLIVYPLDAYSFYQITNDGRIEIIIYEGTGEEFNANIEYYKLLTESEYETLLTPTNFCTMSVEGDTEISIKCPKGFIPRTLMFYSVNDDSYFSIELVGFREDSGEPIYTQMRAGGSSLGSVDVSGCSINSQDFDINDITFETQKDDWAGTLTLHCIELIPINIIIQK